MLEQSNQIDMAFRDADGKLVLVVTDAGMTPHPAARLSAFLAKLRAYSAYVGSPDFTRENSGLGPENVVIELMTGIAPTAEMRDVQAVSLNDGTSRAIPVRFQEFPPGSWERPT